jgi:hypothetical protein
MNENAPTNQDDGVDTSFIDMAEGKPYQQPAAMEAVRQAQESGDPSKVAEAQKAADEKYMISPEVPQENFESNVATMKSRAEKSIDDLYNLIVSGGATDEGAVEKLVGEIANDLSSIKTLKMKNGAETATVPGEVSQFPKLDSQLLQPLKVALLSLR